MHQRVTSLDRSTSAPDRVSLLCGESWVRVPAWWAETSHHRPHYRHGQTVRAEDQAEAREAAAIADEIDRMTRRLSMSKEQTPAMTDTEAWGRIAEDHMARRRRPARALGLWVLVIACAVAVGVYVA